ncbi:hypothetical protein BGY98DRAFT_1182203 [Russula aff. rugulosa BPL654]|nr:hypothetical protein BGY98DRAFT_1182203 [Russula aff. rugulosa BPL654]
MSEAHVGSLPLTLFSLALDISSSRSRVRRLIQAFLLVLRFLRRTGNTLGAKRPVLQELTPIIWELFVFYAAKKAFGTLSVSQNPIPLLGGCKANPDAHIPVSSLTRDEPPSLRESKLVPDNFDLITRLPPPLQQDTSDNTPS